MSARTLTLAESVVYTRLSPSVSLSFLLSLSARSWERLRSAASEAGRLFVYFTPVHLDIWFLVITFAIPTSLCPVTLTPFVSRYTGISKEDNNNPPLNLPQNAREQTHTAP